MLRRVLMLKIKYTLLVRHFDGKTSSDEDIEINRWLDENITNFLTYKRLKGVWTKAISPVSAQEIKEEQLAWKGIIQKILKEDT